MLLIAISDFEYSFAVISCSKDIADVMCLWNKSMFNNLGSKNEKDLLSVKKSELPVSFKSSM